MVGIATIIKIFGDTVPTITVSASDFNLSGAPTGGKDGSDITALLGIVYLIAGIVAVVVIIIGGIRYTTSNGDSGQVAAAKNTILYAVVGLVVIIMAASITQFVISSVTK